MNEKCKIMLILFLIISLTYLLYSSGGTETVTDKTPPVTIKSYSNLFYEKNGEEWINGKTIIWLNATDEGSGVNYTHYEIYWDNNGDGIIDQLVENKTIYDNTEDDEDIADGKISVKINISTEGFYKIQFYSEDNSGNKESLSKLVDEWSYKLKRNVIHTADNVTFGSSPAVANISGNESLEIFTGSDEFYNFYPELNKSARGIWRCFNAFGKVIYALDTKTDEARSSPAIADIDMDGKKEVIAGTTSGWFLEIIEGNQFDWTFPSLDSGGVYGGPYVWHSSPAVADVISNISGIEIIIGNNPYNSVWCFDGDNSDGIDDGITITKDYFPGYPRELGDEGIDWDVLWVFNTSGHVIATPAIGDVDNDGWKEVVVGDLHGKLYVINATNGEEEWNFTTNDAIFSSAALADIDDNGIMEIIFGSNDSKLYCLEWNGSEGIEKWNFTTGGAIYSSPSIGDINADNEYEIIFGSSDHKIYCLSHNGSLLWNLTTGGKVYSSPSLTKVEIPQFTEEWPIFRGNLLRNGFYPEKGNHLEIFVGSEDKYMYEIDENGNIISRFLTNGPIHTSPSLADIDGDGLINVVFYDWGSNYINDTFWCLEKKYLNVNFVKVDTTPPQTVKNVMSEDKYNITTSTTIWLNSTDEGNFSVGVKFLHYEIWHDGAIVENCTINDNSPNDSDPRNGSISVSFNITEIGINEIRWYAEDYVGNREDEQRQEHKVISYAPNLVIIKNGPHFIHPLDLLNYTLIITNNGNENATNVTIIDIYDSNTTYISADPEPSIGNNTWIFPFLNISESKIINITLRVKAPLPNGTLLNNTVSVTCDEGVRNETYEITQVISAPELVITKDAIDLNNPPLEPGDKIHYIINITNVGNMDHENNPGNELEDYIPSNTSYEMGSLKASKGTASYDSINNKIIWNGMINVSDTITIEFNVTVRFPLKNGTIISNDAKLYWDSDGDDINDAISHAYANLTVKSSPLLTIVKEDSKNIVHPGERFNYIINVTNNGNENATNVTIIDIYDSNTTYISADPEPSTGNNEWHIDSLSPGEYFEIEIEVEVLPEVREGSVLINFANVTCDEDAYNETIVYTPVLSYPPETYPPETHKEFDGRVINVTLGGDKQIYILHYILNSTNINLVATDNGSGVNKTYYRIFKLENGLWHMLFDWEEYGVWNPYPPFYPINVAGLGKLYNFSPCGKYEIEFYSVDNAGNVEDVKWNDVFVDCYPPLSYIYNVTVERREINVYVDAIDKGVGVGKVVLYYRYSVDNISWGDWIPCGEDNYTWHFSLMPDGYYEFYTVAYDLLGNHEMLPSNVTVAKAGCIVDYPWDINEDGRVNVGDIYIVILHWMETPGDENWFERADVNDDGIIDVGDIIDVVNHWTG